jgi:hypothetical protein
MNKWHEQKKESWGNYHAKDVMRRMELDLFPDLGNVPITQITTPMLHPTLKKVEARDALDLLKRDRQYASQVFTYVCKHNCSDKSFHRSLLF